MTPERYKELLAELRQREHGKVEELEIECRKGPRTNLRFLSEYIWAVLRSTQSEAQSKAIYDQVWPVAKVAVSTGVIDVTEMVGHVGKAKAINEMVKNYNTCFLDYVKADDKVEFVASLPWVGKATKWILAVNLGADVVPPDDNLEHLAHVCAETQDELLARLAAGEKQRSQTVAWVLRWALEQKLITLEDENDDQ
jgi:hypothetical protein